MQANRLNSYSWQGFEVVDSVDATNDKLRSFTRLHSEGFAPSSKNVLSSAVALNRTAQLWGWATDAFPGLSGEILVSLERGSDYFDVIFETNGSITLVHEVDDEDVSRTPGLSFDHVLERISRNAVFKCAIYDSFARTGGIPARNDSYVWRFEIPVQNAAEESQSWTETALKNEATQHVSMWENIISNIGLQSSCGR